MRWTTTRCVGVVLLGVGGLGVVMMRGPSNPSAEDPLGSTPRVDESTAAAASGGIETSNGASNGTSDGAEATRDAPDAIAALRAAIAANVGGDLSRLDSDFAAAAEADPESALAIVAELKATHSTFELGGAGRLVLDAIRDDARLLERWIEVMLQPDPPSSVDERFDPALARIADAQFVGSGIAALALLEPDAALAYWRRLDAGSYNVISDEVLRAWLADDPHDLLRHASALGIGERARVIREWAKVDLVSALAYAAERADFGAQLKELELRDLAIRALHDGEATVDQLFAAAALLPDGTADYVRSVAVEELAKTDPDSAAARLAELGVAGRNTAVASIARRYAEREPFSALAWARQQGLMNGELAVVEVAAKTNPQRAFDLALQTSESVRDESLRRVIAESLRRDATSAPALANRLETLAPGSRRYEVAMTNLVSSWLDERRDDAFAWIVANAARLPDEAHTVAARRARADELERIVARLPPDARAIWLAESR